MQGMEIFFVNEAKLQNVADQSQEMLVFLLDGSESKFWVLTAVLVWPSDFQAKIFKQNQ